MQNVKSKTGGKDPIVLDIFGEDGSVWMKKVQKKVCGFKKNKKNPSGQGSLVELLLEPFFNKLKESISLELENSGIGRLEDIYYNPPPGTCFERGKDLLIIFKIDPGSNQKKIKIPLILESKSHQSTTGKKSSAGKGVDLAHKIDQVALDKDIHTYWKDSGYAGASYCVFAPFVEITEDDTFSKKMIRYTSFETLDFPDHFWYLSLNVHDDIGLKNGFFSFDQDLTSVLKSEQVIINFFKAIKQSRLGYDAENSEEMKKKLGKYIAGQLCEALQKHKDNPNRIRQYITENEQTQKSNPEYELALKNKFSEIEQANFETKLEVNSGVDHNLYKHEFEDIEHMRKDELGHRLLLTKFIYPSLETETDKFLNNFDDHVLKDRQDLPNKSFASFNQFNESYISFFNGAISAFTFNIDNNLKDIHESYFFNTKSRKIGLFYNQYVDSLTISKEFKFITTTSGVKTKNTKPK